MLGRGKGSGMVKVMGIVSVYIEVREEKTDTYTAVLRCLGHDLIVLGPVPSYRLISLCKLNTVLLA